MANEAISVNYKEYAELIRATSDEHGRFVQAAFGPGWVKIEWWKCKWVLPILPKMRGVAD